MLKAAAAWVGYLEKAVPDYGCYEAKTIGAGRANFTRFGRIADIVLSGQDKRVKDGYPWCAMFILAILYEMKAGRQDCGAKAGTMTVDAEAIQWVRDTINGGRKIPWHAGCQAWANSYRERGLIEKDPAPGDFVVYLRDGKAYHIGIVESVVKPDIFITIEGNTSANGEHVDPNGGAVARKKRHKSLNCVFCKNNFVFLRR